MTELYSTIYVHTLFFLYPFVCQKTCCIHILAIVNNAAVKMEMQISLRDPDPISFWYVSRSGIVSSYSLLVHSILNFLGTILFPLRAVPIYISTSTIIHCMMYFELIFVFDIRILFHSFACGLPAFLASFLKRLSFSYWVFLVPLSKISWPYIYFSAPNSVPLVCVYFYASTIK